MSADDSKIAYSEYKSAYWHVLAFDAFSSPDEAKTLMVESEALFTAQGKIQRRRTNLTLGERAGMTYKVMFGYGESAKTTVRRTLAYEAIRSLPTIRARVERQLKASFPLCAALRYPDGAHGIKRHKDREVPAGSTIAGISVGETRTLVLSTWKKDVKPLSLELKPGSLYVFLPPTNERSFHAIEAEPDKKGARISFTFRTNWSSDDGDIAA